MKASLFTLVTCATVFPVSMPAFASDAQHPIVVELFQSQGCSSTPPANTNLIELSKRPDVLALSFAVTYWDQLGWKDTFDSPQYTERQWDYARALHDSQVWTPQMIVNGRADIVGSDKAEIEALMARADRGASGPTVAITPTAVSVGAADVPRNAADAWRVRYEPRGVRDAVLRSVDAGRAP